ncbi:hypothetical protein BC834DRAFT_968331 [Gloeopeniophorella convolvens]|nr:hypothetical protein BC834DRAFT_968331 [Gloeopeniophorella convolvens]
MDITLAAQTDVPTNGPILIEGILQALCQGVIFAQTARYFECPLNDTMRMKSYVSTLLGLSTLQTILNAYKIWYILIYLEHWSTSPLDWADLFLNGLICTVCEVSLLRRCWKVTKERRWVIVPLTILLVTLFVANLFLAIELGEGSKHGIESDSLLRMQRSFPIKFSFNYWIFGSLVLDVTITSILMVWLWHSRTGLDNLDKALNHIIVSTWESAAVPSVLQIIAVSLYNTRSEENQHLVTFFLLVTGKFYTLGILRSLNSRSGLQLRMTSAAHAGRQSLSEWQWEEDPEATVARRSSETPFLAPVSASSSSSRVGRSRQGDKMPAETSSMTQGSISSEGPLVLPARKLTI